MDAPRRQAVGAVTTVLSAVALALGITLIARGLGSHTIFGFFTLAAAVAAWRFGAVAATMTVVLSAALVWLLFDPGSFSTRWAEPDLVTLLSFAVAAMLVGLLTDALRRSRDRAQHLLSDAEESRRRAVLATQAKDRFLATMSHELRTPLNAVIAYGDLLESAVLGDVTPRQRHALGRLNVAARHLGTLVNDLLDVARLDSGHVDVERTPVSVNVAVNEALALVEPMANANGVRLQALGPAGTEAVGDAVRLRQIVVNLLSNAVKFSPRDGSVAVHWGRRDESHQTWISVRDSGIGIAPEHHERIFAPFEQVDDDKSRSRLGTGLGLTISQRLARLMDGELTVESALGEGACFTLWLPQVTSSAPAPSIANELSAT